MWNAPPKSVLQATLRASFRRLVSQYLSNIYRGSAINRTSRKNISLPRKTFFWPEKHFFGHKNCFCGQKKHRPLGRHPPPGYILVRIAIYFAFRTFLRSLRSGRPRCLPSGRCWTGGRGPKRQFLVGRLSWMTPNLRF